MTASGFELTGRHVAIGAAAAFAVVLAANTAFITLAVRTFPGEDRLNPYEQGLKFNQAIAERKAAEALGWRVSAELSPVSGAHQTDEPTARLTLRVTDRDGRALEGATISGALRRPVSSAEDRTISFRAAGGGVYVVETADVGPGQWDLRAEVVRGEDRVAIDRRLTWRLPTP